MGDWPEDSEAAAGAVGVVGGDDGIFCIRGGEEGVGVGGWKTVKMSSDVAAVMKREAND